MPDAPALAGIHHLKLPVTDLARSREWYQSRLGYQVQLEFVEQGRLMGYTLAHPNGGPQLALRLNPERARAAAGFDYFAIGVPDREAIDLSIYIYNSKIIPLRRFLDSSKSKNMI